MKCPMCGKSEIVCVGPWESINNQFGLGFNMADGRTCCSLSIKFRGTREEAQALANTQTLRHWAADQDLGWTEDQEDLIGDQSDGDPYDREPFSF